MDWSKVKFRASSWGNLLTEPKTKEEKMAGTLSVTTQKELIKIYNRAKYGRKKEIVTAAMEKGKLVENDSIAMYSRLEGRLYYKNDEELENEWFTGHPDVFAGDNILNADEVDDIKNSWSLDTFTPQLIEAVDRTYICQLNVYYDLTGARKGNLVRTLMDCPPEVLEGEKYYLLRSMNVATEENTEYKKALAELVKNLTFPDIPPEERLIKIPVPYDEELIEKMKAKVPVFRKWLADFEEKHMKLYPKDAILV